MAIQCGVIFSEKEPQQLIPCGQQSNGAPGGCPGLSTAQDTPAVKGAPLTSSLRTESREGLRVGTESSELPAKFQAVAEGTGYKVCRCRVRVAGVDGRGVVPTVWPQAAAHQSPRRRP